MSTKADETEQRRRLLQPRPGSSVWPRESCAAFTPRQGYWPGEGEQCWYCRYADFHLREAVALEVGICCWPRLQIL